MIGVILGLLSSVKYPFPFMLLPFGLVGISSFIKKESKFFLISLVTAPVIYLAQYAAYFAHGHSLFDFLQFEKYRLSWWTGDRTMPKFLVFQNLFTGQFPAWWEENLIVKSEEWNVFLPLLFVGHLFGMGYVAVGLVDKFKLKMKSISTKSWQLKSDQLNTKFLKFVCSFIGENLALIAMCLYSLTLILLYGFGAAVYLRYLTQLVPFWIVVCMVAVERFLEKRLAGTEN